MAKYTLPYEENIYRLINDPITVKGGNAPLTYLLYFIGVFVGSFIGGMIHYSLLPVIFIVGGIVIFKLNGVDKPKFYAEDTDAFNKLPKEVVDDTLVFKKFKNK